MLCAGLRGFFASLTNAVLLSAGLPSKRQIAI
jgi:hypothetical protein